MTGLPKYDLAAASELLHLSVDILRRRCRAGIYPHMRPGRKVMFSDDQIDAICAVMSVEAKRQDDAMAPVVTRRRRSA